MQKESEKISTLIYLINRMPELNPKPNNPKPNNPKPNNPYPDNPNPKNNIGISIGNSYHYASWAVINSIRGKKQDGYNTCVFDLMISNYAGVVKCIK